MFEISSSRNASTSDLSLATCCMSVRSAVILPVSSFSKPDDTAVVDASGLQLARDGAENGVGRRVHNLVFRNSAERRRNAQLQQHNASDH